MKDALPQTLERSQECTAEPRLGGISALRPAVSLESPARPAESTQRVTSDRPQGLGWPRVLIGSVVLHAALLSMVDALPRAELTPLPERNELIVLEAWTPPAEEEPVVQEPVEVAPAAVAPVTRAERRPLLHPAAEPQEPQPERNAEVPAPPSLEDVFAFEPSSAPVVLTGAGTGGAAWAGRGVVGASGGGTGATPGAVGSGPSESDIRQARRSYARVIRDLLESHARYPIAARAQRIEGRVELALRIGSDGSLIAVRVASSSGFPLLDEAALAVARELGRFPAPPSLVPWDSRDEVRTPLVYELVR